MMEKKYTVKEFVDKYVEKNSKQTKEILLKSVIVNNYIPYAEKIAISNAVIDATSYETVTEDGAKILKKNSPSEYMNFMLIVVDRYTSISVDFSNDLVQQFDLLDKNDLIDAIIGLLPESELVKMNTVFRMCKDDFYENNKSLVPYLRRLQFEITTLFGDVVEKAMSQIGEDTIKSLIEGISNGGDL